MTDKGGTPALPSDDIQAIVDQFNASHWRTLELELRGTKLFLSKDDSASPNWASPQGAGGAVAHPAPMLPSSSPSVAPSAAAPVAVKAYADGHAIVRAPSLGTFYRSPKPGAAPFIQIGDEVEAETELCLIEVMKLFTTLRTGVKGKVAEILVEDGVMVEYDQPLFVIDTNG